MVPSPTAIEAPEAVLLQPIHAGLIEDQVGIVKREQALQVLLQPFEIFGIAAVIRQRDVQAARLLGQGIVAGRVHAEGEDRLVLGEEDGGAVSLMHVEVDDERPAGGGLGAQNGDGHGDVVEEAVAFRAIGIGVMRAAGQVAGNAVLQRGACRLDGAVHRPAGAAHQGLRPRESEAPLFLARQLAPQSAPHVRRIVRARAALVIGRSRWLSPNPAQSSLELALEPLLEASELTRRGAPAELRAEIASLIANVCYDIGTPDALERALIELTQASQILLDAGRPLDAARLLNDEAAVWVKIGDFVRANHLLSRSREVFGKVSSSYPPARVELLETEHLLARLVLHAPARPGRERDALQLGLEHALAAEEGYRDLDDARNLARVWETIGRLELRRGRPDEAIARLEAAQQQQRRIGDAIGLARSSGALSEVYAQARDYPRALERLAESIAFNSEKGSGAGLRFNLASLRQIEPQLPVELHAAARALEQRLGLG